jgi:hypothetical protein
MESSRIRALYNSFLSIFIYPCSISLFAANQTLNKVSKENARKLTVTTNKGAEWNHTDWYAAAH